LRTPLESVSPSSGSRPRAAMAATCASRSSTKIVTGSGPCDRPVPRRRPIGPRRASRPPQWRAGRTSARRAAAHTKVGAAWKSTTRRPANRCSDIGGESRSRGGLDRRRRAPGRGGRRAGPRPEFQDLQAGYHWPRCRQPERRSSPPDRRPVFTGPSAVVPDTSPVARAYRRHRVECSPVSRYRRDRQRALRDLAPRLGRHHG
jgi:hypothetical protein